LRQRCRRAQSGGALRCHPHGLKVGDDVAAGDRHDAFGTAGWTRTTDLLVHSFSAQIFLEFLRFSDNCKNPCVARSCDRVCFRQELGITVRWFLGGSWKPRKRGLEMRNRRITKKLVDRLRPASAEYFVWDNTLIGFGVRVQPTGSMSYIAKYRAGSGRGAPTRRVTLGRVGTLTPDEARTLAPKRLGGVAHGTDPAALRAAERRASTIREVAEIFLAEHVEAKRKRTTATHYRSLLEKVVLPELGSRKAEQVTTFDLAKLHAKMRN